MPRLEVVVHHVLALGKDSEKGKRDRNESRSHGDNWHGCQLVEQGVDHDRGTEARQSAEVRRRIAGIKRGETLLLVTHQVNITAITGIVPAMGEAVVVRAGKGGAVEVVGRLAGG